jgi:hypothetical protein
MTSKKSRRVCGSSKKAGTRLGTQIRGEMAEQYDQRGHGAADLVLHYSGKTGKDAGIKGLREFKHYLHVESDPDVVDVDYMPHAANTKIAGKAYADLVHTVVKLKDGSTVWRRLVESEGEPPPLLADLRAAVGKGALAEVARVEVWTSGVIEANAMRLRNSLRVLGWIAGARYWPLGEYKSAVLELLGQRRSLMFGDVVLLGEGPKQALFGAAVLQLACNGAIRSDLNEAPLSGVTLLHRLEV